MIKSIVVQSIEFLRRVKTELAYKKKIRKKIADFPEIKKNKLIEKEAKALYDNLGILKFSPSWHRAYSSINGIESPYYMPEDIFYSNVVRKLNSVEHRIWQDKLLLPKLFGEKYLPETILYITKGKIFDKNGEPVKQNDIVDLVSKYSRVVCKPCFESGQARGVFISNSHKIIDDLKNITSNSADYLVQECITQSSTLAKYHPSSLNTVRVMTVRVAGQIKVVSSIFRIGVDGRSVDNGGVFCGIKNGTLNNFATDLSFKKHFKHPTSNLSFGESSEIFKKAEEFACERHKSLPYFNLVSWDSCVDENDEPLLIEYNLLGQEINFHQVNNGPVFEKHLTSLALSK